MTLAARLMALERRAPATVTGYQITRVAPDGAILEAVVIILDQLENGRARTVRLEDFTAAYPNARIVGGVLLADPGNAAAAAGSLYRRWFPEADA